MRCEGGEDKTVFDRQGAVRFSLVNFALLSVCGWYLKLDNKRKQQCTTKSRPDLDLQRQKVK